MSGCVRLFPRPICAVTILLAFSLYCAEISASKDKVRFQRFEILENGGLLSEDRANAPLWACNSANGSSNSPALPTLTAVLPLKLKDLSRASILLASLEIHAKPHMRALFEKFVVIVPRAHIFALSAMLRPNSDIFPFVVVCEESLFSNFNSSWDGYAVQMAVKLLISRHICTDYYVTLDADVLMTRPVRYDDLVQDGKAIYFEERREEHPMWWSGSERLLQLSFPSSAQEKHTFGVTPAVLHTSTARAVVQRLNVLYGTRRDAVWLSGWRPRMWWSEYTMYRLWTDFQQVFDDIHIRPQHPMQCHSVWWPEDLPWNAVTALDNATSCLFSVVQSSLNVSVEAIAESIYRLFPHL